MNYRHVTARKMYLVYLPLSKHCEPIIATTCSFNFAPTFILSSTITVRLVVQVLYYDSYNLRNRLPMMYTYPSLINANGRVPSEPLASHMNT